MSYLALFLMGPPRIECSGQPITFDDPEATALLSYLAITRQSHPRQVLIDLLWPGAGTACALDTLEDTLQALRSTIGSDNLETYQEAVRLKPSNLWVDVDHFRSLLAECTRHGHPAGEVCLACQTPLTEATHLYRGALLNGVSLQDNAPFNEWAREQATRLQEEMAQALDKLAGCLCLQGDFKTATAHVRRRLALDPLHEPAHRQMMRLYTWAGQPAAAQRHYHLFIRRLKQKADRSPDEQTTQLYGDIRNGHLPPPPTPPSTSSSAERSSGLPSHRLPFLGREEEMAKIADLLANPLCRLLTLSGPGGIGKTRLALQAAAENSRSFLHGVCFVPLAPISEVSMLVPAVASALRFPFQGGADPKVQLLNYLHTREMLLVFDNFEHLTEGAPLLAEILTNAPEVKILVTSREQLSLQWEWPLEISGLDFPAEDGTEDVEAYSSVKLFVQSVHRVDPSFSTSSEVKPCIARICRYLEGIPLGIELAATWGHSSACIDIVQRIEQDLDALITYRDDVPERHRSLRVVFDHSWNLLSEEERDAFKKLSVFRGVFQREAARVVVGASLPILAGLLRKSFLHKAPSGRYEMLEVLRQYAYEKLQQSPAEQEAIHDRHCEYYADFLHQREEDLKTGRQAEAVTEISEEIENIRAAWHWAVNHGKTMVIDKSLGSLNQFYEMRAWVQEGEQTFQKAVTALENLTATTEGENQRKRVLGRVLAFQSRLCLRLSRFDQATEVARRSISIFQELGLRKAVAFPLQVLGGTHRRLEDYRRARQLLEESLAIYAEHGNQWGIANCLNGLAIVAATLHDFNEAKRLFHQALTISQEIADHRGIAARINNLGLVASALGEYQEAKQFLQESIEIARAVDIRWGTANSLGNLGFVLYVLGEREAAKASFEEAMEIALDTQSADVAMSALIGMIVILNKEKRPQQVQKLIDHTLHHPTIYHEIKNGVDQILIELESQLSVYARHDTIPAKELEKTIQTLRKKANRIRTTLP